MKIAVATLANLPCPPVKGGAIETLIDNICLQNETKKKLDIDIYSIYDLDAQNKSSEYKHTQFYYFKPAKLKRLSFKNIIYKLFHISLPDKNMNKIVAAINRQKYDYVIFTTINRELKYVFKQIKSPVIWYLHGDPISVLGKNDLEDITSECSSIITVSDFINRRISSIKNAKNVHTVLNCTDITPIKPEEERIVRSNFRKTIAVESDETLITYVGRITPIKGILELVRAFVENNTPKTKLLIIGAPGNEQEHAYYNKLKETANENVIFYGYVNHDELNKVYCSSDIVAVPSTCYEAAQLTVLEALICNRQVIATKIGGVPEYVFGNNYTLIEHDENFENRLKEALLDCTLDKNEVLFTNTEKYSMENLYNSFCNALNKEN